MNQEKKEAADSSAETMTAETSDLLAGAESILTIEAALDFHRHCQPLARLAYPATSQFQSAGMFHIELPAV